MRATAGFLVGVVTSALLLLAAFLVEEATHRREPEQPNVDPGPLYGDPEAELRPWRATDLGIGQRTPDPDRHGRWVVAIVLVLAVIGAAALVGFAWSWLV